MVCTQCGKATPGALKRCIGCGARLAGQSQLRNDFTGEPPESTGVSAGSAPGSDSVGPLAPGQPFGPRYRIVRLLGVGAMGAVYETLDNELNVPVALKVIRPEITADPDAARVLERRLKQELLLARQVTDQHVVRIHDLGEIDGIKYVTRTYVAGADLSTVLRFAGRLEVTTALRLARQIATGLKAAHEAGVVHGHLQPAGIMIDGEKAVIKDFGIARAAGTAGGGVAFVGARGPEAHSTTVDASLAAAHYMAPELASGAPADQRADVYGFGRIFREMLLGGTTDRDGAGALDELYRRKQQAPHTVRSLRPDVPEAIDTIITKCVNPDRSARYPAIIDLLNDLSKLDDAGLPLPTGARFTPKVIAAIAVGVLAAVVVTWWLITRS